MTAILGVLIGGMMALIPVWWMATRVLAKLDWAMRKVDDNKRISEGWYLKLEGRVDKIERVCHTCKTQPAG